MKKKHIYFIEKNLLSRKLQKKAFNTQHCFVAGSEHSPRLDFNHFCYCCVCVCQLEVCLKKMFVDHYFFIFYFQIDEFDYFRTMEKPNRSILMVPCRIPLIVNVFRNKITLVESLTKD